MKSEKVIEWSMGIPYADMANPFAVGDRILHDGQRVEIISLRREIENNQLWLSVQAIASGERGRIWHKGAYLYSK